MYQNGDQVRFEILGNLPIKNNYIAIYDFTVVSLAFDKYRIFVFYRDIEKYKYHEQERNHR